MSKNSSYSGFVFDAILHTRKYRLETAGRFILGLALIALAGYLCRYAFIDIYPELDLITFAFFLVLLGGACFRNGFKPLEILAYTDRIEMKSICSKFDRTILWDEITGWNEQEVKQRSGEMMYILVFKHRKSLVRFNSSTYGYEYQSLVSLFGTYKADAFLPEVKRKLPYHGLAMFGAIGLLMIVFSYSAWM